MDRRAQSRSKDRRSTDGDGDSLDLILGYSRQSYDQQFSRLETYRTRAGSLLAFAAVLVALSAGAAPRAGRDLAQAVGTVAVLIAAVLFLVASSARGLREVPSVRALSELDIADPPTDTKAGLLRNTLVALRFNRRLLTRVGAVLSVGLAWLLVGTILIGVRVTLLLL
jgi:hypothetical protein